MVFGPSASEKDRAAAMKVGNDIKVHPMGKFPKKNSKTESNPSHVMLGKDETPLKYRLLLRFCRCMMSAETIHKMEKRAVSFRPQTKGMKAGDAMIQIYDPKNFQNAGSGAAVNMEGFGGESTVTADYVDDGMNPTAAEIDKYQLTAKNISSGHGDQLAHLSEADMKKHHHSGGSGRRMTFAKADNVKNENGVRRPVKSCLKYRSGLYPSTIKLSEICNKGKMVKDAKDLQRYQMMNKSELIEQLEMMGIPFRKDKQKERREEWIAALMHDPRRYWGMDLKENVELEEESETGSDSSEDEGDMFWGEKNKKIKRKRSLTEKELAVKARVKERRVRRQTLQRDKFGREIPRKRYKPNRYVHFHQDDTQIQKQMSLNNEITSKMDSLITDKTDYSTTPESLKKIEKPRKVRILPIVRINIIEGFYNFYNDETKKRTKAKDLWWTHDESNQTRKNAADWSANDDMGMCLSSWLKVRKPT